MARPVPTRWMPLFDEFVQELRISSKEVSSLDERGVPLLLWDSQKRFLQEIAAGLEQGVRIFYFCKARQLGITTVSLVVDLFWVAIHNNLTMAIVTDTEANRDKNRMVLRQYINSFPKGYFGEDFYIIKGGDNRGSMKFSNGSRIDFKVAGTREKGSSWAEGEGYAAAHLTECSKYGSPAALASFEDSFSQTNPDRLFIYESTAAGFNHWREKWYSGLKDPYTKRSAFCGWWSSDVNRIERSDPRYLKFGVTAASGREREQITAVQERYSHKITPEQLAWIRWKEDSATAETEGMTQQNNPWTIEDSFVMSGSSFFQTRMIQKDWQVIEEAAETIGATAENPYAYTAWRYRLDGTFFDMKLEKYGPDDDDWDPEKVELRIWEQPVDGGEYVIGMDPAWGLNEHSDCHVASVWRCYADKMVQVAEYAANNVEVKHAAWILAHLAGAYVDCIVNVELTGGAGRVIMMEWETLRQQLQADINFASVRSRDWDAAMQMARWYLYNRPDTMGRGFAANFEATWRTKQEIMYGMRGSYTTRELVIRSKPLLEEMRIVEQDGDQIAAPNNANDDRVIATALAIRAWTNWRRGPLLSRGLTYERVRAEEAGTSTLHSRSLNGLVARFLLSKEQEAAEMDPRPRWMTERGLA